MKGVTPVLCAVVQGVNLTQAKEKGQLVFLEGLKASPGVLLNEDTSDTTHTFDYLRSVSRRTLSTFLALLL